MFSIRFLNRETRWLLFWIKYFWDVRLSRSYYRLKYIFLFSFSLVDCFLVAMAPVGVSLSPTGDFLATAHVDSLGVYLWSEPINFQDINQSDYQLPITVQCEVAAANQNVCFNLS